MVSRGTRKTWQSVVLILFITLLVIGCTSKSDEPKDSASPNGGGSATGGANVCGEKKFGDELVVGGREHGKSRSDFDARSAKGTYPHS